MGSHSMVSKLMIIIQVKAKAPSDYILSILVLQGNLNITNTMKHVIYLRWHLKFRTK